MIAESIRHKIETAFTPKYFELENESHQHSGNGTETHFRLLMVSDFFKGMNRVDRQRKVMDLFVEERSMGLHALTLRLLTNDEWDSQKQNAFVSPACHGGSKK